MPRLCTICQHPNRDEIDRDLVGGSALPSIAAKYRESGDTRDSNRETKRDSISIDSLGRHKANHLPPQLVQAQAAEQVTNADDLLSQIARLDTDAATIFALAKRKGDMRSALAAVRERTRVMELMARIKGEIDERAQVLINNNNLNANFVPNAVLPELDFAQLLASAGEVKPRFQLPAFEGSRDVEEGEVETDIVVEATRLNSALE